VAELVQRSRAWRLSRTRNDTASPDPLRPTHRAAGHSWRAWLGAFPLSSKKSSAFRV